MKKMKMEMKNMTQEISNYELGSRERTIAEYKNKRKEDKKKSLDNLMLSMTYGFSMIGMVVSGMLIMASALTDIDLIMIGGSALAVVSVLLNAYSATIIMHEEIEKVKKGEV